jgi:hypothetical protein
MAPYDSYKQASSATGIPAKIFKRAKAMGAPGFRSNRIYFEDFKPWYEAHKAELETPDNNELSLEEVKKENLIKDGVIKDLEIKKRRKEYLDPVEVKSLLQTIGTSAAAVLKRIPAEYPQRLAGKTAPEIEVILTKLVTEIITIYKSGVDNWI